jgi:acyl-CoA dehydrogenase
MLVVSVIDSINATLSANMDFDYSAKSVELQRRLVSVMDEQIYPHEQTYRDELGHGDRWRPLKLIEELKQKAKSEGLWNLFLPDISGLSNVEYAPLAEVNGPRCVG